MRETPETRLRERRTSRTLRTFRIWLAYYLLAVAAFVVFGCASGPGPGSMGDVATDTAANVALTAVDTMPVVQPPPVVPFGIDTSFVVQADSLYGVVMNTDTLAVLEQQSRRLDVAQQQVDTLASVLRFLEATDRTDENDNQVFLSSADSAVVGGLLLRALAGSDDQARSVVSLDRALTDLSVFLTRTDSLHQDLGIDLFDPGRAAVAADLKVAILGFSSRSRELRDRLSGIVGGLDFHSLLADSARSQREVKKLFNEFGQQLDVAINEMGTAAQSIGPSSLSTPALRGLQNTLVEKRETILELQALWDQFVATSSLDLSNPDRPYNPRRVSSLLTDIYGDLGELVRQADSSAAWIDTADSFQSELAARKAGKQYLVDLQQGLLTMKEANRKLVDGYNRLSARYWQPRLEAATTAGDERTRLFEQLDVIAEQAGGLEAVRDRNDLADAYRAVADRLIANRRAHLRAVSHHDRLRKAVQIDLARDLFNRARVLGERRDYDEALVVYERLLSEEPGEYPYLYQMGSLAYFASREDWASTQADSLRERSWIHLARCEEVLLERFAFDRDMTQVRDTIAPTEPAAAARTLATGDRPRPSLAAYLPEVDGYYYQSFLEQGWQDLDALGSAVADRQVSQWLLSVDSLRKRLAFDARDGDRFLYHYARQIYLSDDPDTGAARQLLEYWSWDDGNLRLKERWTEATLLPDSTRVLARSKHEVLQSILAEARTPGVRRAVQWAIGTLDFLKLDEYDAGLDRMYTLLQDVARQPNPNPEVGNIDSTIVEVYPVLLYNRGTYYQQAGRQREAFYCFLGVAEQYGREPKITAMARYSAASVLADGNKKGALQLVRSAVGDAMRVFEQSPTDFDPTLLVGMYELRQRLAGDLGLFSEAIAAREEARSLAAMLPAREDAIPVGDDARPVNDGARPVGEERGGVIQ